MSKKKVHPLAGLLGLGPKSAEMLTKAGIRTPSDLRRLGAAKAFVKVRSVSQKASLNLLWALEGALGSRPWQEVARNDRLRLLLEVEDLESRVPRSPTRRARQPS
jgi:DNA transformation protein and related proteins